jgi:hypothetical protein
VVVVSAAVVNHAELGDQARSWISPSAAASHTTSTSELSNANAAGVVFGAADARCGVGASQDGRERLRDRPQR